jgi:cyclic pyranopterin phosphate synthase
MDSAVLFRPKSLIQNPLKLVDPFGRKLDYLRLSITERCNLRCTYCMPEHGVPLHKSDHLLSYEEMDRLTDIFTDLGIKKIRITGGEPFVRKEAFNFIQTLNSKDKLTSINITTNGVFIGDYLNALKMIKLGSLNISLDSLKKEKFFEITRRDEFEIVYKNLMLSVEMGLPVKVNMVVMNGVNDDEIIPFARLTEKLPVEVRFIEQMPFSGGKFDNNIFNATQIKSLLEKVFLLKPEISDSTSTSLLYRVPGFEGKIGIIAGYSRTFCGSCNRLRITADGMLKTCLYDRVAANLKTALRSGRSNDEITEIILNAVAHRAKNGFESQQRANGKNNLSMAQIGG